MTLIPKPETCYEIYRCESCYEVCVVENPYYYPLFYIGEFPRYNFWKWLKGKKTKIPEKGAYVKHYGGICEKCLKIKNPRAILTEKNPIDLYRNAKKEYKDLVKKVMRSKMRSFENSLPLGLLKELNHSQVSRHKKAQFGWREQIT